MKRINYSILMLLVCGGVFLGACSMSRVAGERYSQADLAIKKAEQEGATDSNALALHEAREQLTDAKEQINEDEFEISIRHSEKAIVNAELASAQAQNSKSQILIKEVKQGTEALRKETTKKEE